MCMCYNSDVILYDYCGYGLGYKQCQPNEQCCYNNISMVIKLVLSLQYRVSQIILWGFSLGAAISIDVAQKMEDLVMLICSCPFTSISQCLNSLANPDLKPIENDSFVSYDKVDNVQCPIIFVHGSDDSTVPILHSETLVSRICGVTSNSI